MHPDGRLLADSSVDNQRVFGRSTILAALLLLLNTHCGVGVHLIYFLTMVIRRNMNFKRTVNFRTGTRRIRIENDAGKFSMFYTGLGNRRTISFWHAIKSVRNPTTGVFSAKLWNVYKSRRRSGEEESSTRTGRDGNDIIVIRHSIVSRI